MKPGWLLTFTFILNFVIAFKEAAQFCASDGSDEPVITDPNYMCNKENFSHIYHPPQPYNTSDQYPMHFCDMIFLLDLDQTITSDENYSQVVQFIYDSTSNCMNKGIGYKIFAFPMFNDSVDETICCEEEICREYFGFMNYNDYVGHYDNFDPIQEQTSRFNFSYTLIYDMKRIGNVQASCLYNNIIMITNRLFNVSGSTDIFKEIEKITDIGCITFTVIAVGNEAITSKMMYETYSNITLDTYAVPSFNCLDNLRDCIPPCGSRASEECYNVELKDCPFISTPTIKTTTPSTTTPKPTPDPALFDDWQIIYLFAISNRTSETEFKNLLQFVSEPIKACQDRNIVVRFLAKNESDSDWISDLSRAVPYLSALSYENIFINTQDSYYIDKRDNVTLELVLRSLAIPLNWDDPVVRIPRITLLTDFVSQNFVNMYNTTLLPLLEVYDFNIIAFTQESYNGYKQLLAIKSMQILSDVDYGTTKTIRLCDTSIKSNVTLIMVIIIGTCAGAMSLLIIVTILYRQKYMWIEKLNRFKISHGNERDDDDIIDYWEISNDRVVVKNEKLGHGAFGHVYRAKMRGVPPAIEKYHPSEMSNFTDCEVAVKVLPHFASDIARKEFENEIQLMKELGFNEHIITMLGCISQSNKPSLVLEYCVNRDLLRYVKQKKSELDMTKSVDDTIDATKEFLNFGWQVAQGMIFLENRQIVHRDLAARNILISEYGGMKNAKISDFGLAIKLNTENEDEKVQCKGRLPIKWLAPECLESEAYSFQSDVWSYGIVVFEMYSLGEVPYMNVEPKELLPYLKQGNRPKLPLLASDKLKEVMVKCWQADPQQRPTFEWLSNIFASQLELTAEGYGYLELVQTADYRVVNEIQEIEKSRTNTKESSYSDNKLHPDHFTKKRAATMRSTMSARIRNSKLSVNTNMTPGDESDDSKIRSNKSLLHLKVANFKNLFSKDNEFKKTLKKRKTTNQRRGSVPVNLSFDDEVKTKPAES